MACMARVSTGAAQPLLRVTMCAQADDAHPAFSKEKKTASVVLRCYDAVLPSETMLSDRLDWGPG